MEDKPEGEKPKIIIDEDWKTQVQAEKEAAQQEPAGPAWAADSPDEGSASEPSPQEPTEQAVPEDPAMPPASFQMLLTGLATEAMMSLGQIPHPMTGEATVRRNQAKYLIDTIGVLQEKTKGNLSDEEQEMIDGTLNELRMQFVEVAKAVEKAAANGTLEQMQDPNVAGSINPGGGFE